MKVNYKALGGLFEFKYYTGDDVSELNEEELAILEEEVKRIQKDIDARNPQKKEKKPKTAKDILGDKDIPYEVRMKYIIDSYRKDQEKWSKLIEYAKHLEKEVIRLKGIMIVNGYADSGNEEDSKPAKAIKELKAQIKELEQSNRKKDVELKDAADRITDLENRIDTFPLRIYKTNNFKNVINNQKKYIEELQQLLDDYDIPYEPMRHTTSLEKEGVDKVVNEALAYLNSNKESFDQIIKRWESK